MCDKIDEEALQRIVSLIDGELQEAAEGTRGHDLQQKFVYICIKRKRFLLKIMSWSCLHFLSIRQREREREKTSERAKDKSSFKCIVLHQDGRGVHQSDENAFKWQRKAAEQRNATGQYNLGFMYKNGRGAVAQSDEEAVKRYEKDSEQGHARPRAIHPKIAQKVNNMKCIV